MKNNKFYTVNNVITKELINRGVLVEDTEGAYNGTITVDDIQYTLRAHWSNNFRCGIFGKTEAEATEIIRFFLDIVNNYEMKIITNQLVGYKHYHKGDVVAELGNQYICKNGENKDVYTFHHYITNPKMNDAIVKSVYYPSVTAPIYTLNDFPTGLEPEIEFLKNLFIGHSVTIYDKFIWISDLRIALTYRGCNVSFNTRPLPKESHDLGKFLQEKGFSK